MKAWGVWLVYGWAGVKQGCEMETPIETSALAFARKHDAENYIAASFPEGTPKELEVSED
jgi:hypothetical protein